MAVRVLRLPFLVLLLLMLVVEVALLMLVELLVLVVLAGAVQGVQQVPVRLVVQTPAAVVAVRVVLAQAAQEVQAS